MRDEIRSKKLTESYMGKVFARRLAKASSFNCFPRFAIVRPEVACLQGQPDFIAIASPKPRMSDLKKITRLKHEKRTASNVRILALLKYKSARTKAYLVKTSGYTKSTVQRALSQLAKNSLVKEEPTGSYKLSPKWRMPTSELWVFELKLNKWRRALFQGLQCKSYGSHIVTVFPKSMEGVLQRNAENFKRHGIGILIFDPNVDTYSILVRPRKNKRVSRMHYLYVLSQMDF